MGGWVRSKYGLIAAASGAMLTSDLTPQKNCKPPRDYVICAVYKYILITVTVFLLNWPIKMSLTSLESEVVACLLAFIICGNLTF